MPRHATLEAPPPKLETPSSPSKNGQRERDEARTGPVREHAPTHNRELFRQTLLEVSEIYTKSRTADFLFSLMMHTLVVVLLVLISSDVHRND